MMTNLTLVVQTLARTINHGSGNATGADTSAAPASAAIGADTSAAPASAQLLTTTVAVSRHRRRLRNLNRNLPRQNHNQSLNLRGLRNRRPRPCRRFSRRHLNRISRLLNRISRLYLAYHLSNSLCRCNLPLSRCLRRQSKRLVRRLHCRRSWCLIPQVPTQRKV